MKRIAVAALVLFALSACGKSDRTEFHDGVLDGEPINCRVVITFNEDIPDYVKEINCTEGTLP